MRTPLPPKHGLDPPIEIGKFFKNRKGDIVAVQLKEYEGQALIDVRQWFTADDGITRPTKRGVTISVRRLSEFADLINKAVAKAHALGLLGSATP